MNHAIPNRLAAAIAGVLSLAASAAGAAPGVASPRAHFIVEAGSTSAASALVSRAGGHVTRQLPIINAVAADLTRRQEAKIERVAGVRVFQDRAVGVSSTFVRTSSVSTSSGSMSVSSSVSTSSSSSSSNSSSSSSVTTTSTSSGSCGSTTTTTSTTTNGVTISSTTVTEPSSSSSCSTGASSSAATGATNSPPQIYSAANAAPPTAAEINATALQAAGTTGAGVTIAMLDTGFTPPAAPYAYDNWGSRILATVDFSSSNGGSTVTDLYGHGTQITSVIGSAAQDPSGLNYGVAPGANFVIVRAFDGTGAGTYSNVISGLNWIVDNQARYNIRVVNLSLGTAPQSYYWNDPLNQAVMKAWQAGIVVVAAAGNSGPAGQTIDVPGNVPYVITVGAVTDNYQPNNASSWKLASFSSVGPTYEGFVKPEVLAPGGHILATMPNDAGAQVTLTTEIFGNVVNPYTLFPLSGTSQATAVTSGAVALLLQNQPTLTPDEVKCKLMASSAPAVTGTGKLAYSVFQQGAGLINVLNATSTAAVNCANQGLNIAADLAGTTHFGGPANRVSSGIWYVMNMKSAIPYAQDTSDGNTWSGFLSSSQVAGWSQSYLWSDAFAWSNAYVWTASAPWSSSTVAAQANLWTKSLTFTPASVVPANQSASAPFPAQEQ